MLKLKDLAKINTDMGSIMFRQFLLVAAVSSIAACSGNVPVLVPGGTTGDVDDIDDGSASAGAPIERYEEDGQASDITYDPDTDTFSVDNLAFDGAGTYDRDDIVPTLNGFRVYENNNLTERRAYKALYLESDSGLSRVAIVRTGSYRGFGFGGFVYSRNGTVTLPTTGQATYTGEYAGMRVFDGISGLEYTTADAELIVDFEDFNSTRAVEGTLTNRIVRDTDGSFVEALPTLIFATGAITDAGEIEGQASSTRFDPDRGEFVNFESGNYYAVVGGDNAEEIVGVVVVTATDPDNISVTIQETGGFIAVQ